METRSSLDGASQQPTVTYFCQVCRARLIITSSGETEPRSAGGLFDASRIEESFIVLDNKRGGQAGSSGLPSSVAGPGTPRGLDESFVLLPNGPRSVPGSGRLAAASALQSSSIAQGNTHQQAEASAPGLDAKLQALSQLFDLAATNMQVDHPLCLDCASQLKDEMEAQIQEAEQEIAAYAAAVAALEADHKVALPEEEFVKEMQQLQKQQDEQRQAAAKAEQELQQVRQELSALQAAAADLDALDDKYWRDYNEFQALLKAHVDERDALLARIASVNQRKQLLQATNVYNDAFKIWHDGPFATISGFRLGRTPEVNVEWDEINAAWGQAVLLLHTMAQNCGIPITTGQLIPMGSHPRVKDRKGAVYDLFGPVSKLWSSNYDKAMVCYLSCLKEFGEKAEQKDPPFGGFPFPIDGDKVNNHTIKLTLNKDAKWTKALKFMLANLKKALTWMVRYEATKRDEAAQRRLAALRPEPVFSK